MNKAPPPDVVAKFTRWAILLFFAYALLTGSFHLTPQKLPGGQPQGAGIPALAGAGADCGSKGDILDDMSQFATTLVPAMVPSVRVEDIKPGTGDGAACGQHATLRYSYALQGGKVIFSNLKGEDSSRVTLGDGRLLRGVEQGMLGMKAGAERKIAFPGMLGFGAVSDPAKLLDSGAFAAQIPGLKNTIIVSDVSLLSLSPPIPASSMPLRVVDRKFTGGVRAQCGDTVSVEMTVWKLDGTKLFTTAASGALVFTAGSSQLPFGIEQAVQGMSEDGWRTVIIPAAYVGLLAPAEDAPEGPLSDLPKILLAEIHLLHIGEKAPVKPPANK